MGVTRQILAESLAIHEIRVKDTIAERTNLCYVRYSSVTSTLFQDSKTLDTLPAGLRHLGETSWSGRSTNNLPDQVPIEDM